MLGDKRPRENAFGDPDAAAFGAAPTVPASDEEPRTMTAERAHRPNPFRALAADAATPTMPNLEPGTVVKHYEFLRLLGAGGMGKVFLARDTRLGRLVAVKLLLNYTGRAAHRFLAEARTTAQCRHENIVVIYDVDEYAGYPYMVLEYIEGRTLRAAMNESGRNGVALAIESMISVTRALVRAHEMGIVHRDLKPENILLSQDRQIKVLDFGIAKQVSDVMPEANTPAAMPLETKPPEQTQAGALVGTLGYMSPEQIKGEPIDARTDIWAVGVILYELVTGERPLKGDSFTQIAAAMQADDALPSIREKRPELGALAELVDRCLQKRKEDRFESAKELLAALERVGEGKPKISFGKDELAVADEPLPQPDTLDAVVPDAALRTGDPREVSNKATKLSTNASGKTKRFRWAYVGGMGLALAGAVVAGVVLKREAPKPVAPVVVAGIECAAAAVTGSELPAGFADALGQGACARLGIELGVPWHVKGGMRLGVRANVRATNASTVTLELAGKTAEGTGKTSIAATNDAIQKLAPMISVPAFSPERIKEWGAKDEASARRIERGFRRVAFGFADKKSTGEALVQTDPDSAVPHSMLACALKKEDIPRAQAEKAEALKHISRMNDKRAKMIAGGMASYIPTPDDGDKARGITNGYTELSHDPDFAGLYTLCGCILNDETLSMIDWLRKNEPTMGLPLLRCPVIYAVQGEHEERLPRYFQWMDSQLPEFRGDRIDDLMRLVNVDDVRAALSIKELLGAETTRAEDVAEQRFRLALTGFDWRTGLKIGDEWIGVPDVFARRKGALMRIHSLLLAGRVIEAQHMMTSQLSALIESDANDELLDLAQLALRIRRVLARPAEPETIINEIRTRAAQSLIGGLALGPELALLTTRARNDANAKAELDRVLGRSEEDFQKATQRWRAAFALPLLRYIRGNDAVASAYREMDFQPSRWYSAFEAALAFQAIGAKGEAEKAYRLSMEEPWFHSFEAIAARLRLADMLHANGREDEARELLAIVDKAWSEADPGLREAVRGLK